MTAASSTARPWSASTPVTRLNRPGRSGATTVSRSPSPSQHLAARSQQLEVLGGGEVVAHLVGRAAARGRGPRASHEVADEVGLPPPPRRRTGGEAVGLGEARRAARGCAGRRPPRPPPRCVAGSSRSRRVATSGSSRWWRTIASSTATSAGGEPHAGADGADQLDADLGVVARVALADVVQQRTEHEQVGPIGAGDERRRVGARLHEVPVDGEAVVGVALRLAAHGLPLRQHVHPQAHLVERLDHRDGAVPGEEEVDEGARGPRSATARGWPTPPAASRSSDARWMRVSPAAAAAAARSTRLGSRGGIGVGGEVDLAVAEHQAAPDRPCPGATAIPAGPLSDASIRCHASSLRQAIVRAAAASGA